MLLVEGFFTAFSVIDTDCAFEAFKFEVAKGLAAEVIKAVFMTDGILLLSLQMIGRRWGVYAAKIPRRCWYIDARAV